LKIQNFTFLFECLVQRHGAYHSQKNTNAQKYLGTSQGRCWLVHVFNTEEKQTLDQSINSIYCIQTLSHISIG